MFRISAGIYLLFFLFGRTIASAQDWNGLNDSLSYYYSKGELAKAIPFAQKMVELAGRENAAANERLGTALNNLAFLQQKTGSLTAAADNYRKSLEIRLVLNEADHADCLSVVQGLVTIFLAQGKNAEAIKMYSDYLQVLRKAGKQNSATALMIYYKRAEIYLEAGQYEKAKPDLIAIAAAANPMRADTMLYYNTFNFLAGIYGNEKNIALAEPYFLQHVQFCKWVDGENSEAYSYALYRLAGLYSRGGSFDRAEPVMKEVLKGYEEREGRTGNDYSTAALNYVTILLKNNKREKAEAFTAELLEQHQKKSGNRSSAYEHNLFMAAMAFLQGGQNEKGESFLQESIQICRGLNNAARLVSRLCSLDSFYSDQQQTSKREAVLTEILALQEKTHALKDSLWSVQISSLASLYIDKGDYANAATLAEKFDSITTQIFTGETEEFIQSRRSAAYLFSITERMDKAERYYLAALKVAKKIWKEDDVRYARLLRNVGTMYYNAGLYKKAGDLLRTAAAIFEKSGDSDYDQLADIYHKLASAYDRQETNTEEEAYLIKAVEVAKKIRGGEKIRAILSNNLAYHYEAGKQYSKADSMYEDTQQLTNRPGEPIYNFYLIALVQQGVNAVNGGLPQKGEACISKALQEAAIFYKGSNIWDDRFLLFICEYYRVTQQYPKAVDWGKKLLQQERKKMGEDNPAMVSTLVILSRLFFETGHYRDAEEVISLMNRISLNSMLTNFEVMSDAEKEKYIANKISTQHLSNTLLFRQSGVSEKFIRETFDQTLLLKSLILAENRRITASVLNSSDTVLRNLYKEWLSTRQLLAKEYAKPKSIRPSGLEAMEEKANQIQKEISGRSSGLLKEQKSVRVSLQELQATLREEEAIIEFVSFGVFREKADSAMYAAFVLRRGQKPVFVPLCEKKELDKLFDSAGTTATAMVNKFYRGTEIRNNQSAAALGGQLYKLVWAPLEPYLKGINSINYSPAGKLYSIAFHALPVDSVTLLMDRYALQQYISTRQVALNDRGTSHQPVKSIALFGDPAFSLDSASMVKAVGIKQPGSAIYTPQDRGSRGGIWGDLPGTAAEVEKLQQLFQQQQRNTKSFTQAAASEENLKALSDQSPQVLHIATHGFFLPDPQKEKATSKLSNTNSYTLAADPLLRSGLILAGGNRAWSGKAPIEGIEDGILTAYEISQLNLSNTELVVLSACETALGDVKGTEGVFGLQRAFKMAGVKKMIVSLWQVPDKETAELMTTFYGFWLNGKDISEAFAAAQSAMRKKYSAYYWAAFVLVE